MVIRKLRCPTCGYPIQEEWNYCPNCGTPLGFKKFFEFDFGKIFEDFEKEFREMLKTFKPFKEEMFEEPFIKGGGISIKIESGTGKKPKIEIKTFGDYKNLEPKIKEQIMKKYGIKEEETEKVREVKVTEEPEAKIVRKGNQIEIEVLLPDVENENDIEVKELEESIEIKAYAKDKAYFKIISKPTNKHIADKKFEKGKLIIILE
jgi:HSP20 family molecular chaperone IbpA